MSAKNRDKKNQKSDGPEYALVYSTDPQPVRNKPLPEKPSLAKFLPLNPAMRLERKGRGGKSVTIAAKLPANEQFLKNLCAYLKRSTGSGGTFYIKDDQGVVEIQGERQKEVLSLIASYKPD